MVIKSLEDKLKDLREKVWEPNQTDLATKIIHLLNLHYSVDHNGSVDVLLRTAAELGAQAERAAIVDWLRSDAANLRPDLAATVHQYANGIEAGPDDPRSPANKERLFHLRYGQRQEGMSFTKKEKP